MTFSHFANNKNTLQKAVSSMASGHESNHLILKTVSKTCHFGITRSHFKFK